MWKQGRWWGWMAALLMVLACTGGNAELDRSQDTAALDSTPATSPVDVDVEAIADAYAGTGMEEVPRGSLDHLEWLQYCAQEFGFTSTISTVPGQPPTMVADVHDEQRELWMAVDRACTREAVERGWVQPVPQSDDELREEYRRLLGINDCLAELGYGTEPPSEEAFIDGAEWNVYANTPRGGLVLVAPSAGSQFSDEMRAQLEIQETCPPWPDPESMGAPSED